MGSYRLTNDVSPSNESGISPVNWLLFRDLKIRRNISQKSNLLQVNSTQDKSLMMNLHSRQLLQVRYGTRNASS